MLPQGECCYNCPHAREGQKFIGPDGYGSSGILLLGDSPWIDEQKAGRVFSGAAGRMLDRILKLMPGGGLRREDLTIWNTIQCSPLHLGWMDNPRRFPAAAVAIEHCRPHLDELIAERRPRVIIPMGNVALRRVCGTSGIEAVAGYVLPTPYGIPAVPTYHPSFLMKGKQNLIPVVLWALSRALGIASGEHRESEYELLLDPTPEEAVAYFAQLPEGGTLFIDIETPESGKLDEEELEEKGPSFTIIRAGASVRKGTGISFPFQRPFTDILFGAIAKSRTIVEWADNRFDTRRLAVAGASFDGKQIVSGMWAWHWLQSDLRKGLNLVAPFYYCGRPWKHLSQAEPAFYNAMDNAVGMDCYIGIRDALVAQKRWDSFMRYCSGMTPILESMGRAGIVIDTNYRDKFMEAIRTERDDINVRIQAQVPDALKPRKFWKKPPKDMTGVVALDVAPSGAKGGEASLERLSPALERLQEHDKRLSPTERPREREQALDERAKREVLSSAASLLASLDLSGEPELGAIATKAAKKVRPTLPYRFMRVDEFNPGSPPQVQELARHLGIKMPKKEQSDDPDDTSTDEKALKRAAKQRGGKVFHDILEWRKRAKLINAYSWPVDAQNRVHYQFGFHPSTWRKSCRSVNIQTIPKRSDLAKKFRRMLVAAPGCVLVEGDSSAIEAVLVGHLANSERYIRLAKAGVHGWLTSALHNHPIKLSLSDTELAQACRNAKKQWPDDYEKCKRVTHLTGYLGTPRRIYEEYPDDFESEAEARKLQQFLLGTEIGDDIKAWQRATVEEAHGNKYLENFYGLRHRFYSLFQWNPRRQAFEFGDDAKRAVAFRPQSIASFIQSDVVFRVAECWLGSLRAIIHDSVVLEVPIRQAHEAAQALEAALTAPISQLGGLSIGAEVSIGSNLAPWSDDNPSGMVEASKWKVAELVN